MDPFSIWPYLFVIAGVVFLVHSVKSRGDRGRSMLCKSCGFVGSSKSGVPGSLGVEILLWLCLIVPGLIYSLWRDSARYRACPKCGGKEMIPADSPVGKKIINETNRPQS